jgi:uncharacterized iron-regulated membrane protein
VPRTSLYSAIWRWHFYAGLITLPFLMLLAITGGFYLFKDEIDARVYRDLLRIEQVGAEHILPSEIVELAKSSHPGGRAKGFVPPAAADQAARVVIEDSSGKSWFVFVNPYTGAVHGDLARGEFGNLPLMEFVRRLHSLEHLGWFGNRLVEIVAGWALILVATGIFLWWPRRQRGGVVTIRRDAGHRVFWRDLHAVTGIFAACFIAFLALTGLPWSGFWGDNLRIMINEAGVGYPGPHGFPGAESRAPLHHEVAPAPWIIADVPVPSSGHSGHSGHSGIGIDQAIATFEEKGLAPGYAVSLPVDSSGVYSASVVPHKVAGTRTVHLDQYTGETLFDAAFDEFGPAAQAIEYGISIHTGQQFGVFNQLLMLMACVAILTMAVSAVVMWWKRKPRGSLGAPAYPANYAVPRGILLIALVAGILFPLVGLSILVMLALDLLLPKRLRALLS